MIRGVNTAPRFSHTMLDGADEPVRRYFEHAISDGAPLAPAVRLRMRGRIRVGAWLPFTAEQDTARDRFSWTAWVGAGRLTVLRVVDAYADGGARTEGRLFGRARLFHSDDEDTIRSAAGRAALEAVAFAPATVLPGPDVEWRAESDDVVVGALAIGPERPEVRVRLGPDGSVRSVSTMRWGRIDRRGHRYHCCGCDVLSERRFGDFAVPARFTVTWGWDTPGAAPFFRAEVTDLVAVQAPAA
jgi:Family of unknown function (DUF6544)